MIQKNLKRYLIPNIFAMVGISFYVLADTFFISAVGGSDGITLLNLTLPIYGLMFAIGSMIGVGSATRFSLTRALGKEGSEAYFSNSILSTLLVSLPFLLLGLTAPSAMLRLMGGDDVIVALGTDYMRIVLLFAPFFMTNYTFTAFVRNDGNPRTAMAATLLSSLFNVVFDYVLMFPLNLGIFGAALATGFSPVVSMLICCTHLFSKRNTLRFVRRLPSLSRLLQSCSLGISAFVGEISNAVTSLTFNVILLNLIGNIAVAAYGVVANVSLAGFAIFNGISQGLQPLASEAEGLGDLIGKRSIARQSRLWGLALSLLLVVLSWVFTEEIVSAFNSENSTLMADYAVTGLRIYSLGFPLAATNIINAGFFSATGRATACSILSLSRGIFAILFFAFTLSRFLGILGVWLAFPAAELFTLLLSAIVTKRVQP